MGVKKEYDTLGSLRVQFGIPVISITFFDIAEQYNDHGLLTFRAVVPEEVTQEDVLRCEDSPVTIYNQAGGVLFSGMAISLSLSHTAGYQELLVIAKSHSIQADRQRASETFQSTGKTLAQVAHLVLDPCGVQVTIPQDMPLSQMLTRENETAWEFIRRVANEQGLYVYADSKSMQPHISIGLEPFGVFPQDVVEVNSEGKNISDFFSIQYDTGNQVPSFQLAKQHGYSPELLVGVGYKLSGSHEKAVIGSRITSEGDLLVNRLTLTDPVGAIPVSGTRTLLQSTVLTGKVLEVQGVEILVQFNHDGPAAGTRWILYESPISNYFYCMPQIGDTVFAYYQNDGTIVCLGSRWSGELPDFEKPEDRLLLAQKHMIKASTQKLEFVLERDHTNPENFKKTHISFKSGEGLIISTEECLQLLSLQQNICLASRPKDWVDTSAEAEVKAAKDAVFETGLADYTGHGGGGAKPSYSEDDKLAAAFELYDHMIDREFKNNIIVSSARDFGNRITSSDANAAETEPELEGPFSTGIINILASEYMSLNVQSANIQMDNTGRMGFSAPLYEMYGSDRQNYERVELENYSKRDMFLDGLQAVLGVVSVAAWLIPPPAGAAIAIAADAVDAGISVARGDMIGAGLAVCGVFGDVAKGAKIMGKAGKIAKTFTTASKVTGAVETVFGVTAMVAMGYNIATTGFDIISEGFRDGWTPENLAKLQAWSLNLAKQAAQMLATTALKGLVSDVERHRNAKKAALNSNSKLSDVGSKRTDCVDDPGDPVDPITGSFEATQTDFILPDINGEFRLMRRHKSLQSFEKQLLGSRWVSSLGMRLVINGEFATMLKDDLYTEQFQRVDGIWINTRAGDRSYELFETQNGYQIKENTTNKVYYYNEDGCLTAIVDTHGNQTKIDYCGTTIQRMTLASGQYLDFTYETGKVSRITDRAGRSVCYEYDGEYLVAVTYPNGGTMRYQYDRHGMITHVTDQNGIQYLCNSYDETGRVVKQDIANGEEHAFLYCDADRKNTYINPQSGRRIVYHYNQDKLMTKVEYDDGSAQEFEYDQWGNVILEKDRNGGVTRKLFRQDGKLLRHELPTGLVWNYEYDERGNCIHWWNSCGEEHFAEFDSHNNCVRERQVIDEIRSLIRTYTYDRLGRMISMTDGNGNETRFTYWENSGRIASVVTPEGDTFQYTYDQVEQCMSIQSVLGMVQFGYTPLGARAMETDALGNTTRYRYDLLSNLIAKVMPNQYDEESGDGSAYRYEYDAMDHRVSSADPLGNVFATPYDPAGRMAMEVNPNTYDPATKGGQGVRYEYDTNDRRIRAIYPDGGVRRMKYDALGNLVKVIEPEQYDTEADDGPGYTYEYDGANNLVQIANPDGVVEKRFIYNARGLLLKEISADGYLAGDSDETRIGTLYQYNAAGWLLEKREPVVNAEDGGVRYRLTQYAYDCNGNRTAEKRFLALQSADSADGSIHTLTFGYDKQNRLVRVSDGLGAVIQYAYNCLNQRTKETRLLSEGLTQVIHYRYDAAGRLVEVSQTADKEGCGQGFVSTKYEYDRNGNITRILLPAGGGILREYDAADRLIAETHKEKASGIQNRTQFSYDAAGNLIEITDNQGRKTRIAYDLMNREIRRIEKDGGVQRTVYDRNGKIVRLVRPNQYDQALDGGQGIQYVYDAKGQVTTVVGPDGQVFQTNTYDAAGRLVQQLDGVGSGAKYSYDLAGLQRRIETVGGSVQELEYDAWGNITGIVDGNRNRTQYQLDPWGRIIGIIKADGSTEQYTYDFAGNMTSSTDGEGHTTRYQYNRMGKIAAIVDPMGGQERYAYDGQGRMVRKTDRNGVTVEFGYNLYGAPLFKKAKDSALGDFYEYTPEGLLKCAISAGMRYAYEYDALDRMIRKSASGRTLLALTYDGNGNKVRQTDVAGKVTEFVYSPLDLLTEVWDDGHRLAAYEYNADGTIRAESHGPVQRQFQYDLDKNLTGLLVQSGGELLAENQYLYDGNGNRTLKRQLGGDTLYHYDPLNQLKKVEYPSYTEELFYDKAGNRTRRIASGVEELYQYDPRNRLTAYTKGGVTTMFQYDHAGNLLADDKARYSYDAFNRTEKVETFDGHIQFNRYDAEGLRYEMEENGNLVRFIFNQNREAVTEEDASGLNRLIRASELIAANSSADSARTYYHYASDEMGSTTHIVDEAGAVQNRYEYDAWGNITAKEEQIPNRFTYYGQQIDPVTQQYYLRARFYNPVVGRFTQEDIYRGDGLNLYAYCDNNPITYADPSGYSAENYKEAYKYYREMGYTPAEAYQLASGRIGVKPQYMSDQQMQWAVDEIYMAQNKNKPFSQSVYALTVTPDGRAILSTNGGNPSGQAVLRAKQLFGAHLETVKGEKYDYQGLEAIGLINKEGKPTGHHAEPRAFAYLLGDAATVPPPPDALRGVRQAISSNSCPNCGKLQDILGVKNVTGTVGKDGVTAQARLYYEVTTQ